LVGWGKWDLKANEEVALRDKEEVLGDRGGERFEIGDGKSDEVGMWGKRVIVDGGGCEEKEVEGAIRGADCEFNG
jgi:hypothetical protein